MVVEMDRVGPISKSDRSAASAGSASDINGMLAEICRDSALVGGKVRQVFELLVAAGNWTAAVRLVVAIGGHQQADVARTLGVMRSTVARWYNGETRPNDEQMADYAKSLLHMLEGEGHFSLSGLASLID